MRNPKYILMASALLVSVAAVAGPVKTLNLKTSPGVVTEVLLPAGVHLGKVSECSAYYQIKPIHFGKGAAYRSGIAFTTNSRRTKSDLIVNASNGEIYVIWTHNSNHTPAKVIYDLH